jgi:hypothetical protein
MPLFFITASRQFLSWIWTNTDAITKWIQVFALGVAAYWAYTRFLALEAPSLEMKADVNVEIREKKGPVPDSCFVMANVEVTNNGLASFDVRKVRMRVWRTELPHFEADSLKFVDVNQIESAKPIQDFEPYPETFQGHYPQSRDITHTITWTFGKHAQQFYVFRADVEDAKGNPLGYSSRWVHDLCS